MSAGGWQAALEPPVPESFLPWLRHPATVPAGEAAGAVPEGGGRGEAGTAGALPDPEALETAALDRLAHALSPEGRERGGAFDLLAADAFVTWAAEASLDGEAPGSRLLALARRVAGVPGAE